MFAAKQRRGKQNGLLHAQVIAFSHKAKMGLNGYFNLAIWYTEALPGSYAGLKRNIGRGLFNRKPFPHARKCFQ